MDNKVPQKIQYFNKVLELKVDKFKLFFMAAYYHGADPIWIRYGDTPELAEKDLWEFVKLHYKVEVYENNT